MFTTDKYPGKRFNNIRELEEFEKLLESERRILEEKRSIYKTLKTIEVKIVRRNSCVEKKALEEI